MKIAFLTYSNHGHMQTMIALAQQLKKRGHGVSFIGTLDGQRFARAAGIPFLAYCEKEYPLGSTQEIFRQLWRLQGEAALEFSIRLIADDLAAAFRQLPGVLASANIDAIVLDELKTGLGLVPRHME
jgi:UDP:flavonoid glycosyltransferase YjiC (YdhE family)